MTRSQEFRWTCLLFTAVAPVWTSAQAGPASVCFATVEAAARSSVTLENATGQRGFRIQTLVADPILHRAWLRIESCDHPERAAVLVPLNASLSALPAERKDPPLSPQEMTLVASGQAVTITFETTQARMTLHGRTIAPAHLGDAVDVVLDSPLAAGGPPRQIRGRLTAANQVEVRS